MLPLPHDEFKKPPGLSKESLGASKNFSKVHNYIWTKFLHLSSQKSIIITIAQRKIP
jgi:hypothetical protein